MSASLAGQTLRNWRASVGLVRPMRTRAGQGVEGQFEIALQVKF